MYDGWCDYFRVFYGYVCQKVSICMHLFVGTWEITSHSLLKKQRPRDRNYLFINTQTTLETEVNIIYSQTDPDTKSISNWLLWVVLAYQHTEGPRSVRKPPYTVTLPHWVTAWYMYKKSWQIVSALPAGCCSLACWAQGCTCPPATSIWNYFLSSVPKCLFSI